MQISLWSLFHAHPGESLPLPVLDPLFSEFYIFLPYFASLLYGAYAPVIPEKGYVLSTVLKDMNIWKCSYSSLILVWKFGWIKKSGLKLFFLDFPRQCSIVFLHRALPGQSRPPMFKLFVCALFFLFGTSFYSIFFKIDLRERDRERKRERDQSIVLLIHAFTDGFLYVLWPGIKSTTLLYLDYVLTNRIWPGPGTSFYSSK